MKPLALGYRRGFPGPDASERPAPSPWVRARDRPGKKRVFSFRCEAALCRSERYAGSRSHRRLPPVGFRPEAAVTAAAPSRVPYDLNSNVVRLQGVWVKLRVEQGPDFLHIAPVQGPDSSIYYRGHG